MIATQSLADAASTALRNPEAIVSMILNDASTGSIAVKLAMLAVFCGSLHGIALGARGGWRQVLSSVIKAPLIALCSLAISFPLLYAIGSVAGSGLTLAQTAGLALLPLALSAVLVACAVPALLFFGSTSDYHFTKILHVAVCGAAGVYAMIVLYGALKSIYNPQSLGAFRVFGLWAAIYAFTGAQMAWVLRPFFGRSGLRFEWLRRDASELGFYTAVFLSVREMMGTSPHVAAPAVPRSE
ncbi:hypothetical protein BH09SUM1_BH09SUM1_13580 [soil metagenome]